MTNAPSTAVLNVDLQPGKPPILRAEAPVAASPMVLQGLPAALVQRLERLGWLLIRNYNHDIGASLADAFGTDDRRAIESYCGAHAIRFEWQEGGALRTWQRRSAIVR